MRKTSSTNYENRRFFKSECPLTGALEMISGRWKMQILFCIYFGEDRFGAIKKRIPGVCDRMLGLRLGDLITDGLIVKLHVKEEVAYRLTARGQKLIPVLNKITDWHLGK